jgi:hypothetical protein
MRPSFELHAHPCFVERTLLLDVCNGGSIRIRMQNSNSRPGVGLFQCLFRAASSEIDPLMHAQDPQPVALMIIAAPGQPIPARGRTSPP